MEKSEFTKRCVEIASLIDMSMVWRNTDLGAQFWGNVYSAFREAGSIRDLQARLSGPVGRIDSASPEGSFVAGVTDPDGFRELCRLVGGFPGGGESKGLCQLYRHLGKMKARLSPSPESNCPSTGRTPARTKRILLA